MTLKLQPAFGPAEPIDAYSRLLDVVIASSPVSQADTLNALRDAITRYQHNGAIQRITTGERQLLNQLQILAVGELLTAGPIAQGDEARNAYGFTHRDRSFGKAPAPAETPALRPADQPDTSSAAERGAQRVDQASEHSEERIASSQAQAAPGSQFALPDTAKPLPYRPSALQGSKDACLDQPSGKPSCK
jgi:hypothetical protein|tara:strand:- start:12765 stop:13334 length:570 start_codon:yes stop_codon:yes gene_type:complete